MNVFGTPVTGGTRKERAHKAFVNQNAENKQANALNFVKELKHEQAPGLVGTLGMFYNATGEDLTILSKPSRFGHYLDPTPPALVQNGQWGAFVHVADKDAYPAISQGFVVYQVLINDNDRCAELLAWKTLSSNIAYADIFEDGKVDPADDVYRKMENRDSSGVVKKFGMFTTVETESGTSPVYKAVLAREDATFN